MAVKPRYKREIKKAYAETGVLPRHLAGLTEVESGWDRWAGSSAGARWLTQFMPGTAPSYGVRGDSTQSQFTGAGKYLKEMGYKRGDKAAIKLALAKYNAGPGNPGAAGDYPDRVLAASRKYKGLGEGASRPKGRVRRASSRGSAGKLKKVPGVDNSELRESFKLAYLSERGKPDALLNLAVGLKDTQDEPGRLKFVEGEAPRARPRRSGRSGGKPGGGSYGSPGRKGPATAKPGSLIGTPYAGTHSLGNWQSDNAVDVGVPNGTPILAIADGVVQKTGGSANPNGRFGGFNFTLDGSDNSYFYTHLSKLKVKPGQRVRKGQVLGYSGSANGVEHLHLGTKRGDPRKIAARRVARR